MAACPSCDCQSELGFDIKMAFQPIVNVHSKNVFAFEALVRGSNGEGPVRYYLESMIRTSIPLIKNG